MFLTAHFRERGAWCLCGPFSGIANIAEISLISILAFRSWNTTQFGDRTVLGRPSEYPKITRVITGYRVAETAPHAVSVTECYFGLRLAL